MRISRNDDNHNRKIIDIINDADVCVYKFTIEEFNSSSDYECIRCKAFRNKAYLRMVGYGVDFCERCLDLTFGDYKNDKELIKRICLLKVKGIL